MKIVRIAAVLALVLLPVGVARAEPGPPQRESSDPAPGEVVHHVHEVAVTFDEALDPTTSRLRVHACGKRVDSGVMQFSTTGETISVELDESPPGSFDVTYRVRGLNDTPEERMTPREGSFSFALHYDRCEDDGGKGGRGHQHGNRNGNKQGGGKHGGGHRGNRHGGGRGGAGGTDHSGDHATVPGSHTDHTDGHSEEGMTDHGGRHEGSGKRHEGRKHRGDGNKGDHDGKHKDPGGKHDDHNAGGGPRNSADPRPGPARPNHALNLLLVLGIPVLVGALGGRALRARAIIPAR